MEYTETEIEGVWIIQPKVFNDARGYFFEAWKQAEFDEHIGHHVEFIQDNESKSSFGVLRGLHYQKGELSQAKLVRVIKGKVLDVAVDGSDRRQSTRFGRVLDPATDLPYAGGFVPALAAGLPLAHLPHHCRHQGQQW